MALYLDDEQAMLRDSARGFLAEAAPVSHMRELRDSASPEGISRALWKRFGEMGFTSVLIPEDQGGLGLGHVEAGIILEEIGRNLTPSPFLSTAVGGALGLVAAREAYRTQWLAKIAAGEAIVALAFDEGPKHAPAATSLRAEPSGNGFRLSGTKTNVAHGHIADLLLVCARTSGEAGETEGLTLFLVEPDSSGCTIVPQRLVDASLASRIEFDGVSVTADAVVGAVDDAWSLFSRILDAVRVGAASELGGVAANAMEMTFTYLKERRQFDAPIGSFQALQHRAANLYAEAEVARAAVLKAQRLLDADSPAAPSAVAVAKAMAGLAGTAAVQEGVQMHGGIGMTDEHDVGLTMKRARVLVELFGDTNFHADQLARANGY